METKNFRLELKALPDEAGVFEGKLAVYGNIDEGGDVIEPGAFRKTLSEGASTVPLLWNHDGGAPIGSLDLRDSPTALLAKGRLVLSVARAREAYDLMRAGVLKGLSIGYRTIKAMDGGGGVRRLKEIRLFEGSLVSMPMNAEAVITGMKHAPAAADMEALDAFRNASRDLKDFYRSLIDGD